MAGFNLPDGCTDVDIDRVMYCGNIDVCCSACFYWEPFININLPWGICRYKVDNLVSLTNEDIVKEIVEYCVTKASNACCHWKLF